MPRVLLLLPTSSYKATDFLVAADRVGAAVVVGTDRRQALEELAPGGTLTLDFAQPERSMARIEAAHVEQPFAAVVGADDETTVLASMAAARLGLRHNPLEAARAARDKYEMRRRFADSGLRTPRFRVVSVEQAIAGLDGPETYPVVLKPRHLSASRGVIRANDPAQFLVAARRIGSILASPEVRKQGGPNDSILVESFIPGVEVAFEGLLDAGSLQVLALFDKPDPLDGPTFEETLYVTPSRLDPAIQRAIASEVEAGCRALDLREGPLHAELRIDAGKPWLLEIAARTIGGVCSRALRFGSGISLEEIVLRHALGRGPTGLALEAEASGVMMLPVPRAGRLAAVHGVERARRVPGVVDVVISIALGSELVPLPEGHRYPGFVFARGARPEQVERALREAAAQIELRVE